MSYKLIKVLSDKHAIAVLRYLEALGVQPSSSAQSQGVKTADEYIARWKPEEGGYIGIDDYNNGFTSWCKGANFDNKAMTESDFFEYVRNNCLIETVVLNTSYTAIVSREGIKVGCQTFSFDAFDKLAEAVETMRGK